MRVLEALVAAVFEQKVTGVESRRSWSTLVREVGEPAPGPTPRAMHVFPEPKAIGLVPSWRWHRWGVQPHQSATALRVAAAAGRIEQCSVLPLDQARRRLRSIDGVGQWTVAETAARALGDADAVSFGDFHLAVQVVYVFTGRTDGDDDQMAELLAPFAGHRQRIQRLVELSGISRPARGPRATISDHRHR
jgi:3-methyladenine DNA glycosylase/8-oxoguanine DNA glycosylase